METLINSKIINQNLARHQQVKAIQQTLEYSTYQSQVGPTCSSLNFWAVLKHLEITTDTTYEVVGTKLGMIILKGKDDFHKYIAKNQVTHKLHDSTRVLLNKPFEIDGQYDLRKLPFTLRGVVNSFLEPTTIVALAPLTVKLECKLKVKGKLTANKTKHELISGQTITPGHSCKTKILKNGMLIATKDVLKQRHRNTQQFSTRSNDGITAKFVAYKFANETDHLITELQDATEEESNNEMIHATYNTTITVIIIIGIIIAVYYKKCQPKNIEGKGENREVTVTIKGAPEEKAHIPKQENEEKQTLGSKENTTKQEEDESDYPKTSTPNNNPNILMKQRILEEELEKLKLKDMNPAPGCRRKP